MKNNIIVLLSATLLLITFSILFIGRRFVNIPHNYIQTENELSVFPDYNEIVLPPNIAPLNFKIEIDNSNKQIAVFSIPNAYSFAVKARNKKIFVPTKKWKKLLNIAQGDKYHVDIYYKNDSGWYKYKTFTNYVTKENIDSYIAFRHINAGYILWEKMGIYQRNLESFKKSPILLNDRTNDNCMNCHTFWNYNPDKMMIHLRTPPSGTMLYNNGEINFLNTSTDYTMSAGVYPSWHPNGNLIAFSVNKIEQKFHSAGEKLINVYDKASDIVVYDIEKNMISTTPKLSTPYLENLPAWSPDGNYLYYITSPEYSAGANDTTVKYDLLRIEYNSAENKWGNVDTLLTVASTGKSITHPNPSPKGKYISFCMANYGYFTIHNPTSDLYLMNLETKSFSKLSANSDHVESFHAWSSDGNWIMFVSKRLDNLYSRVYFTHVDDKGHTSKPFLLPQKNPDLYSSLNINYNRPVFIKGKVKLNANMIPNAIRKNQIKSNFDPDIDVNALSGATRIINNINNEPTN